MTITLPDFLPVQVTGLDITFGARKSLCHCPVARAACRVLGIDPDICTLSVEGGIDLWDPDEHVWHRWVFGDDACDWINAFDRGLPVAPINFTAQRIEDLAP